MSERANEPKDEEFQDAGVGRQTEEWQTWQPKRGYGFQVVVWVILVLMALALVAGVVVAALP